jgi:hypothetical protein
MEHVLDNDNEVFSVEARHALPLLVTFTIIDSRFTKDIAVH